MIKIIQTAIIAIAFIVVGGLATQACASASLVGQSGPDENGNVICYYENFNDGTQYMKHAKYVCPSS